MNAKNIIPLDSYIKSDPKPKKPRFRTIPDIIKENNSINDQIKLRAKKLSNGSYSLYLDLRQAGRKEYQFLKIYISDPQKDKDRINLALQLRNQKQKELFQNENNFKLTNDYLKINFIEYFAELALNRQKPDKSWRHTLNHLKIYTKNKTITFKGIDEKFCGGFRNYLINNLGSPNTAHVYFSKLKACLNTSIKDGILIKNPAQFIHISRQENQRDFLTTEELTTLKNTPCKNIHSKNAFLFSCFTGLRISDLKQLTWREIQNGYIYFRQQKTAGVERMKLHPTALDILEIQKTTLPESELVFKLISDNHTGKHLKEWVQKAEIKKKVTWHVARHSFATIALSNGVDIFTISKLLGHRDVKVTQIYSKLIDAKKDEAIDKLPKL